MMEHLPECPCSEVPSGRYCYLIDNQTGLCIECECGKHKVPKLEEHPDPYVRNYGIKPSLISAYNDYLARAVKPYLEVALLFGIDAATKQMQDDFEKMQKDK